ALWDRLDALPRAMQWAVYAMFGLILFLIWSSFVEPQRVAWSQQADEMVSNVKELREFDATTLSDRAINTVAITIGPVESPGSAKDGSQRMQEQIIDILERNNATVNDVSVRSGNRMRAGTLPKNVRNKRVMTKDGDVSFEAVAEDVTKIIAEIESSPSIERITQVRMVKGSAARSLNVTLKLEAWVIAE
ncbi:MAG: hypothetical protein KC983_06830, partial [Phycisphaerales bacterium]|nr:hypothetical protein [Phycisphaerales bacterium]